MSSAAPLDLARRRILVTGGAGFIGRWIVRKLADAGADPERIAVPRSADCDLREKSDCQRAVEGIDIVVHAACRSEGLDLNRTAPGELFYDNAVMGIQLMEAARRAGVAKFVTLGSVCAYPKLAPIPFRESELWNGYPEETNAPYGTAKRALLVQGRAYRAQYGMNVVHLLLVNVYGPGDRFDAARGHVIPALIRKFEEARRAGAPQVRVWGTGGARREFLFVEDAADAVTLAVRRYDGAEPLNVGTGSDVSIAELAEKLRGLTGYRGELVWDASMPEGQPARRLDVSAAERELGFKARVGLDEGLLRTLDAYRGVDAGH
jgi:GDP-L-fucose synthase